MIKKNNTEKFNISNSVAYILIGIFSFILIGIGVYAYGGSSPSTMGHSVGEIAFPSCSSSGQALTWNGNSWVCANPDVNDIKFTIKQAGLCYITPVPTCKLTTKTCSNFTFISEFYYYNCASTASTTLSAYCLNNICNGAKASFYEQPCKGDTTACSGGTDLSRFNTVNDVWCSGVNKLNCVCASTENYVEESYSPAGLERCI